jgi:hypothetical protein
VQQHIPAVSGFSHRGKEVREHRRESNHRHLAAPTVRPHVRVPEAQRRPIVHSAPLAAPQVGQAPRQPMPAANGFSHERKEVRQPREHRKEFGHRQGGGFRKHRD